MKYYFLSLCKIIFQNKNVKKKIKKSKLQENKDKNKKNSINRPNVKKNRK